MLLLEPLNAFQTSAIPAAENTFALVGFFPTLCEPPLAVCVEIVVETGDMKHVSCFDRGLWLAW